LGILGEFEDYFLHIFRGPKNEKGKELFEAKSGSIRQAMKCGQNLDPFLKTGMLWVEEVGDRRA
jgi:hypothetical protein